MIAKTLTLTALLATAAAAVSAAVVLQTEQNPQNAETVAASPVQLVFAQPFALDEPYAYHWRADRPTVAGGYILAVAADPVLLPPKQVHNPLLFVGDMPVERMNAGTDSGIYVGLIPSPLGADGEPTLDLSETPIYWAFPEILPESLTAEDAAGVLANSRARAQGAEVAEAALAEGGGTVFLETHGMLRRYAADVIERYSPAEADLVNGLRAPLLK